MTILFSAVDFLSLLRHKRIIRLLAWQRTETDTVSRHRHVRGRAADRVPLPHVHVFRPAGQAAPLRRVRARRGDGVRDRHAAGVPPGLPGAEHHQGGRGGAYARAHGPHRRLRRRAPLQHAERQEGPALLRRPGDGGIHAPPVPLHHHEGERAWPVPSDDRLPARHARLPHRLGEADAASRGARRAAHERVKKLPKLCVFKMLLLKHI